jgi:hypothetical protein
MGLFGPSKNTAWRRLGEEIGAEVVQGGLWKGVRKVKAHFGPWTVTLDTHTVSVGHARKTYTRMRAPFVNPERFRFTIYRKGFFSEFCKLLGMQDIDVGHFEFDEAFIIKGNDEERVRELFANPEVRQLIQAQPKIWLTVKDIKGWFGFRSADGVDELHFQVLGVIKDVERLKILFDLFAALLDQLCRIGSAYKQDAEVEL